LVPPLLEVVPPELVPPLLEVVPPELGFPPELVLPPLEVVPPLFVAPPESVLPPEGFPLLELPPLPPPELLSPPDAVVSLAGAGRQLVVPRDSSPTQQTPARAQAGPRNDRPKSSLSVMVPSLAAR